MIILRTICAVALLASTAAAAERPLKGPEIDALIKGNTVTGKNDYGPWKQYFDANGQTTYLSTGNPPSSGDWTIKGDKFCSIWPPGEHWVCYDVTGDPNAVPKTITWISGGNGAKYPGTVQAGKGL
jgi:hypothetical protein